MPVILLWRMHHISHDSNSFQEHPVLLPAVFAALEDFQVMSVQRNPMLWYDYEFIHRHCYAVVKYLLCIHHQWSKILSVYVVCAVRARSTCVLAILIKFHHSAFQVVWILFRFHFCHVLRSLDPDSMQLESYPISAGATSSSACGTCISGTYSTVSGVVLIWYRWPNMLVTADCNFFWDLSC